MRPSRRLGLTASLCPIPTQCRILSRRVVPPQPDSDLSVSRPDTPFPSKSIDGGSTASAEGPLPSLGAIPTPLPAAVWRLLGPLAVPDGSFRQGDRGSGGGPAPEGRCRLWRR